MILPDEYLIECQAAQAAAAALGMPALEGDENACLIAAPIRWLRVHDVMEWHQCLPSEHSAGVLASALRVTDAMWWLHVELLETERLVAVLEARLRLRDSTPRQEA